MVVYSVIWLEIVYNEALAFPFYHNYLEDICIFFAFKAAIAEREKFYLVRHTRVQPLYLP